MFLRQTVRIVKIRWYERRGYKEVKRFPIATTIPLTHLKRTDLDFVVMRMGTSKGCGIKKRALKNRQKVTIFISDSTVNFNVKHGTIALFFCE